MYQTINYDSKLPKRLHAPVTTFETFADPLTQKAQKNTRPQIWQVIQKKIKNLT
jgi:hypothetical protein